MDLTGLAGVERAPGLGRRSLGALTLVLVVSGCGANVESPTTLPSLRPYRSGSTPASATTELLPIQQYLLRGRDYDTVQRAVTILAQQCMTKQGFQVTLPAPAPARGAMIDLTVGRYGVQSLADAQRYGYNPSPDEVAVRDPAADAFDRSLSENERTALLGARLADSDALYRNGCVGEADKKLMAGASAIFADGIQASPLVRKVDLDPRAVDSPATRSALGVFQRCMAAAGYPDVVDPRQRPNRFLVSGPMDGQATEAERTAAVTQFGCQQSSGVTAAMQAAEVAFEVKAIDANPEAFAQIKAEIAAVVRRATSIVAGG